MRTVFSGWYSKRSPGVFDNDKDLIDQAAVDSLKGPLRESLGLNPRPIKRQEVD